MRRTGKMLGLLLGMGAGLCTCALAQNTEHRAPDDMIYHYFFVHVVNFELAAEKAEAKGLRGDKYRAIDQNAIGLTDEEGALVREVSRDCIQKLMDEDARRQAVINSRRAQSSVPLANYLTPEENARFAAEQKETIETHAAQLREQLGSDAFGRLDAYARKLFQTPPGGN